MYELHPCHILHPSLPLGFEYIEYSMFAFLLEYLWNGRMHEA